MVLREYLETPRAPLVLREYWYTDPLGTPRPLGLIGLRRHYEGQALWVNRALSIGATGPLGTQPQ